MTRLGSLVILFFISAALGASNNPSAMDIEVIKQFTDLVYMGNITLNLNVPLCTQQGITCGGGNIIGLNFSGSGLRGELPRVFPFLKNLQVLDLSNNELTGTFPRNFDKMDKLQACFLNNNRFFGTIQKDFSKIDTLVALDLSNNFLAGPFPPLNVNRFNLLRMLGTNRLCPYPDYSSVPSNDFVFQQSCNICNENSCLSQGTCKVQNNYKFSCNCFSGISGDYCEGKNLQPNNMYEQDWSFSSASSLSSALFFSLFLPLFFLFVSLF